MLLRGLTWLIVFQLLGTGVNVLFLPFLPGPIIGMVLLLIYLVLRGEVGEPLEHAAGSLLKYLPLILVPPAVGVMAYGAEMAEYGLAMAITLFVSLFLALPLCGWIMERMMRRKQARESQS